MTLFIKMLLCLSRKRKTLKITRYHSKHKPARNQNDDYLPLWLSLINTQVANDLNGITQLNHLPANRDIVYETIKMIVFV